MEEQGKPPADGTDVEQTPELDDATLKAELDGMITDAIRRNAGGEEVVEPQSTEQEGQEVKEGERATSGVKLDELIVPEDANVSRFFHGKPVTEVFKSHHHAETRISELGKEVNELKTKLAAQEAVKEVLEKRSKSQEPQKPKSLLDGIDLKKEPLVDPEGFYGKLTERVEGRARQIADEIVGKYKADTMLDKNREAKFSRGMQAIEGARRKLIMQGHTHLKDDGTFDRVAKALITDINTNKSSYGPDGLQREDSFIRAFSNLTTAIRGTQAPSKPQQPAQAAPPAAAVPRAGNPPGASKPAHTGRGTPTKVPTLKHEQAELANQIAARILEGGLGDEVPQKERDEIMEEIRQTTAKKLYGTR